MRGAGYFGPWLKASKGVRAYREKRVCGFASGSDHTSERPRKSDGRWFCASTSDGIVEAAAAVTGGDGRTRRV